MAGRPTPEASTTRPTPTAGEEGARTSIAALGRRRSPAASDNAMQDMQTIRSHIKKIGLLGRECSRRNTTECSKHRSLIRVTCGRLMSDKKGFREVDRFIKQAEGKKIIDPEKQDVLRSRLRSEMLHPLRVMIVSHGPDMELLVANPIELIGKGRPLVFYNDTFALKELGI